MPTHYVASYACMFDRALLAWDGQQGQQQGYCVNMFMHCSHYVGGSLVHNIEAICPSNTVSLANKHYI